MLRAYEKAKFLEIDVKSTLGVKTENQKIAIEKESHFYTKIAIEKEEERIGVLVH